VTAALRAERSGWGEGRVYTVRFECSDTTAGNVSRGSVQVTVPHDSGSERKPSRK
jgi:hypothetical protein